MIQLHQYHSVFGLPNASPFCLKVEAFLRIAHLPYEVVFVSNPNVSPTSKLPFINDEGIIIPDSRFILKHLSARYDLTVDAHLSEAEKAKGVAITRLLEDSLYWSLVYSRWIDERFWPIINKTYFANLKMPLKLILPTIIRKQQKKVLWHQGLGRLSQEQIYMMAEDDIHAISSILGDHPYILGGKISSYDAVAYGFLANIIFPMIETPLKISAKKHSNIENYCLRLKRELFEG